MHGQPFTGSRQTVRCQGSHVARVGGPALAIGRFQDSPFTTPLPSRGGTFQSARENDLRMVTLGRSQNGILEPAPDIRKTERTLVEQIHQRQGHRQAARPRRKPESLYLGAGGVFRYQVSLAAILYRQPDQDVGALVPPERQAGPTYFAFQRDAVKLHCQTQRFIIFLSFVVAELFDELPRLSQQRLPGTPGNAPRAARDAHQHFLQGSPQGRFTRSDVPIAYIHLGLVQMVNPGGTARRRPQQHDGQQQHLETTIYCVHHKIRKTGPYHTIGKRDLDHADWPARNIPSTIAFSLQTEPDVSGQRSSSSGSPISYRDAGVNIEAGNSLVERIKPVVAATRRPGVLSGLGGFGALFELPVDRYRQPLLVSGTDGVGTKLKLAIDSGRHDTIGIDLVAMCANDIVVQGAEPLFFLDYYATGKLDVDIATDVIKGIARGCQLSGAALIGGETAEMPGMYAEEDYDLAGFCVGIVEKDQLIDGRSVQAGDCLIGMAASGPHSNGYSLIRRILEVTATDTATLLDERPLIDWLIEPTRIYVRALLAAFEQIEVRSLCHVTGGGLPENLPRVLPENTVARIDTGSWQWPAIFSWLQKQGQVENSEMYRTFNCGVGMVVCVPADQAEACIALLQKQGEKAWIMGHVEAGEGPARVVFSDQA